MKQITPRHATRGGRAASVAVALLLCTAGIAGTATAGDPAAAASASPASPQAAAAVQPAAQASPITQEQLLQRQAQRPDQLFLLDVRTPEEYAEGHVPGAVNLTHDQLASRLAEVPKDKDVVLYCRSGRRAAVAADVLAAHGYTHLSHLEGDMAAWTENGRPVEK